MDIKRLILRNEYSLGEKKSRRRHINLEWWDKKDNLGDYLSMVICQWMLERKQCDPDYVTLKTIHLSAVGSILGLAPYDAVVWGSGIHCLGEITAIMRRKKLVKYDIRAVRGPVTKAILEENGYYADCAIGDPAVLMPLIYPAEKKGKRYPYSVVQHHTCPKETQGHRISIATKDYKYFIEEILKSEKVISSSLHGIIIAESYGIPAVFWNDGMDQELMKYYDWYYSTDRMSVKVAKTLEEAVEMEPMPLPELREMQKSLLASFPYDLWGCQ